MALKKSIPFTKSYEVIMCIPTAKHCSKGLKSSASINTLDVAAIDQGIKTRVEVWDSLENKMYVFEAKKVMAALYYCGSSDFMAFSYKKLASEVK